GELAGVRTYDILVGYCVLRGPGDGYSAHGKGSVKQVWRLSVAGGELHLGAGNPIPYDPWKLNGCVIQLTCTTVEWTSSSINELETAPESTAFF
ncbi:hypothetical protein RSAG8_09070, partial [Rhizoctonia solani AG-8 WAC10335]